MSVDVRAVEPLLVEVHPGGGAVVRHGPALLVIPAIGPNQTTQAELLVRICQRDGDPSGRGRARSVAGLLANADPDEVPGFALIIGFDADLTVIAQGDVDVMATGATQDSFSAADSLTWIERRLAGTLQSLRVTASGAPSTPMPDTIPFHLEGGTVPGGGVSMRRGTSPATEHAEDPTGVAAEPRTGAAVAAGFDPIPAPPTGEPLDAASMTSMRETVVRPARPFENIVLSDVPASAEDRRPPLPVDEPAELQEAKLQQEKAQLVEGIDCPDGHFNPPEVEECTTCGTPLSPHAQRIMRPRPALGVLVTDDGSVFSVTGDYVIGRAPERDPAVLSGSAMMLVLRDVGKSVSRIHAQLTVSGWQVQIADRGSSNGTFVQRRGQADGWERLAAGASATLAPGARLRIGGRQLLFERYHDGSSPRAGG
jgi:hypothetical protein